MLLSRCSKHTSVNRRLQRTGISVTLVNNLRECSCLLVAEARRWALVVGSVKSLEATRILGKHVLFTSQMLTLAMFVLIGACVAHAQQSAVSHQQPDSEESIINQADEDLRLWESRRDVDFALKVDRRLKDLLRRHPNSPFREQAEERLAIVAEPLGEHNLVVALHYLKPFNAGKAADAKGAGARLLQIICEYPKFSRMEEVLGHLHRVYSVTAYGKDVQRYVQKLIEIPSGDRDYIEVCKEIKGSLSR